MQLNEFEYHFACGESAKEPSVFVRRLCGVVQQMLEEVCLKNGWGIPAYELHETVGIDSKLYAYKVPYRTSCVVAVIAVIIQPSYFIRFVVFSLVFLGSVLL